MGLSLSQELGENAMTAQKRGDGEVEDVVRHGCSSARESEGKTVRGSSDPLLGARAPASDAGAVSPSKPSRPGPTSRALQHGLDDPCAAFPQVAAEIGCHTAKIGAHRDVKAQRRRRSRRLDPRLLLFREPCDAGLGPVGPVDDPEARVFKQGTHRGRCDQVTSVGFPGPGYAEIQLLAVALPHIIYP